MHMDWLMKWKTQITGIEEVHGTQWEDGRPDKKCSQKIKHEKWDNGEALLYLLSKSWF